MYFLSKGWVIIPTYIPYLALICISFALIALSWRKAKTKKVIPFLLSLAGFIFLFEFVIFVIFESYAYFPGVFNNRYYDNNLGAAVSNEFIVPSAAVFIAVNGLGFWWGTLIAVCFMGIEKVFLLLGIFQHFWWKTTYTGLGLLALFSMGRWIWHIIRFRGHCFKWRMVILYFTNIALQGTHIFFSSVVLQQDFLYRIGWFEDPYRGHIALAFIIILADSILFALVVAAMAHWLWIVVVIVTWTGSHVLLHQLGMLELSGFWVIVVLMPVHVCILLLLKYFQKILLE